MVRYPGRLFCRTAFHWERRQVFHIWRANDNIQVTLCLPAPDQRGNNAGLVDKLLMTLKTHLTNPSISIIFSHVIPKTPQVIVLHFYNLLAILDNQAVIIHGHSVKEIERVICMRTRTRDVKAILYETRVGVNQNQLCFVHIFLILGMLYNCYQKGDFPTVVVMKKCTNHSSFSLF